MSLIFQTEERKMLMLWDNYLKFNDRYLAVYIHDGGYVEKLEGETKFPEELLLGGAEEIKKFLGYDVKLTQKEITYEWKPLRPQTSQYDIMKKEFEERSFMVGHQICNIHSDGQLEYLDYGKAKIKYAPLQIEVWDDEKQKMIKKRFLELWIEDKNRAAYERVDFYPNKELCPSTIYNLFKGFNAEKFKPDMPLSEEEIEKTIEPIQTHFDYLTNGNAEWCFMWLANIIQTPHLKSEVAMVIRDMGGLVKEEGGTGKFSQSNGLGKKYLVRYLRFILQRRPRVNY
jgi:hypothetical protein